jgi:hypothetical protein
MERPIFDHDDLMGTERACTSTRTTGTPCETIARLPFGNGQTITGSCGDPTPMHFMGKERDMESNLDDFGAMILVRGIIPAPFWWSLFQGLLNRRMDEYNLYSQGDYRGCP